ncbi:flavodoxin [Parabacteroides timonensis]|uniref:flavodoxin n=1 Tax=Parabacteroides timonensis TaxID=1871013 RepID=UPI00094E0647|nr:flavodoxin [Parabacteroides timonensis]
MKNVWLLLGVLLSMIVTTMNAQTVTKDSKTLVVFFSQTGNTRSVGKAIQELTGADIFELVAAEPYPDGYREIRVRAKEEQQKDIRPALRSLPASIAQYDTIFVGSPIWNYTIAQPVATFLGKFDFKGKVIVPFCTHGGGGAGHSAADVAKRAPGAKVLEGYAYTGSRADKKAIEAWLRKLKAINVA